MHSLQADKLINKDSLTRINPRKIVSVFDKVFEKCLFSTVDATGKGDPFG